MAFLPDDFLAELSRRGVKAVDEAKLRADLAKNGVALEEGERPFVGAEDNTRRYGFPFPGDLAELFRLADTWALEDAEFTNYTYLRVAPKGWELPRAVEGQPLLWTVMRRFEWNTFSNLQLWEHLAGLVSIGWDDGDNRFLASTVSAHAPVFWLDHEYAAFTSDDRVVGGCVASSLERFLHAATGDEGAREPERTLLQQAGHFESGTDFLDPMVPLLQWPPFLAARSEWLIGAILHGAPREHLVAPGVRFFDAERELPLVAKNEPLALYWLLRTFLLREEELFAAATAEARRLGTPLVTSAVAMLEPKLSDTDDAPGALANARKVLATMGDALPRSARVPKDGALEDLFTSR